MVRDNKIREGEVAVDTPPPTDAGLVFIGRIHTPWTSRGEAPRQGHTDGPLCRIEIFDLWVPALLGLDDYQQVEVIYWLHQARRDLVQQKPVHCPEPRGTFALRSPVRPNPLGISRVKLERIEGAIVLVRGLDCLDGTPLVDLKPDRCAFTPFSPANNGQVART